MHTHTRIRYWYLTDNFQCVKQGFPLLLPDVIYVLSIIISRQQQLVFVICGEKHFSISFHIMKCIRFYTVHVRINKLRLLCGYHLCVSHITDLFLTNKWHMKMRSFFSLSSQPSSYHFHVLHAYAARKNNFHFPFVSPKCMSTDAFEENYIHRPTHSITCSKCHIY